jgi:hypothetical protein
MHVVRYNALFARPGANFLCPAAHKPPRQCIEQPCLTIGNCPVSATDSKRAINVAVPTATLLCKDIFASVPEGY